MIARLYPFWKPARRAIIGGLLLLSITAGVELLLPWPIKWLIDYVFGHEQPPGWLRQLAPGLGSPSLQTGIITVCIAILLLGLAHKTLQMLSQLLLIKAGLRTVTSLRGRVIDHLHRLSLRYHDASRVGDSIYRAAYDSYAAQALLSQVVAPVATGILILLGITLLLLRLDPVLGMIALAAVPLLGLIVWAFGRSIAARSKAYHERESTLFSSLQETLSSIRVIQAFNGEDRVAARIAGQTATSERANARLSGIQLAFTACVGLAMTAATALVVYITSMRVAAGSLRMGDILVFLAYFGMLYTPISAFAQSAGAYRAACAQLDRVFEILNTTSDLPQPDHPLRPGDVRGRVEFRNVNFGYDPDRLVLRDINMVVEPGSVIALAGRTGAGKSTLAALLLRFYDPQSGQVLLDGHDLRDLDLHWLRDQVSIVLQDATVFSGTIAENIAFGRQDATRAQIEQAARRAQADEFIRPMVHGYDTVIGERGVNLSGGQRQRLSIARAFLKDAPILVLDEPTSALDARTEAALVQALGELMRGRTTFVIAHRLSTVRTADTIVVIDEGRIAERGTHDELIGTDSAYRQFYESQWGSLPPVGAVAPDPVGP